MNRNLWLLALCQGLFLTNNVVFIAINGLVGLALAPKGWMATLPVLCIVVALSGVDLHQFLIALFLLGVGWNFLFTGSTTLALQAYRPEEKDRAQAAINFVVFAVMALTSFASGALVTTQGWWWLNVGSLLPVALTGLALLWLAWRRQAARPA